MRRSSLVLLIIVEVLALFVFENMRALFSTLEKNELKAIVALGDVQADLQVMKTLQGGARPARGGFFDRVQPLPRPETGQEIVADGKDQRLEIRKPLGPASGLLFQKTLQSRQLDAFRGMRKVLSGLVLFLGLAIAVSGIYLMALLRRKPPVPILGSGSPFQDYLVEMKSSQLELQDMVAAQRRASVEKEELNRSIINTVHLAVIFLSAEGRIEIFNPAAQELFGRSYASARNHLLAEALPGHPALVRAILASDKRSSCEIESGASIFFVDVVKVGAGRLALVRDVSDERQRERIRRQNENLMMLGEMAASLAHEVRNSLGVILGYGKAMSGEPEKSARIVREVQFMSAMMESFLRFAKPVDKVGRKPVDLGRAIAEAAAAQELAVELPASPLEVQSDPLLLSVIFSNLALNARQAGATRLFVEFGSGAAPTAPPRNDAAVTIRDDGPGIAAAGAEKIWLPFFSTRDKGTGMGLATVKKLVSALGGDIQLLNPGEKGAKFRIVFYARNLSEK